MILHTTAITQDLGIRLNLKIGLYWQDLANPKNGFYLIPTPIIVPEYYASFYQNDKRKTLRELFYMLYILKKNRKSLQIHDGLRIKIPCK